MPSGWTLPCVPTAGYTTTSQRLTANSQQPVNYMGNKKYPRGNCEFPRGYLFVGLTTRAIVHCDRSKTITDYLETVDFCNSLILA